MDAFLTGCTLPVCASYRAGEPALPRTQPEGHRREFSGVHIDVSDAEFGDLAGQLADARRFFDAHADPLARLAAFPGVEDFTLDFALVRRDVAVQCDRLPADLVRLCGRYGIGIMLSYYSPTDECSTGR